MEGNGKAYQIIVGGIPVVFATRDDLDDALLGFVEPSADQVASVDRQLMKDGIYLTSSDVERNIKMAFLAAQETTGIPVGCVRYTFILEAQLLERLTSWAKNDDRSVSSLLRKLVSSAVERHTSGKAGYDPFS